MRVIDLSFPHSLFPSSSLLFSSLLSSLLCSALLSTLPYSSLLSHQSLLLSSAIISSSLFSSPFFRLTSVRFLFTFRYFCAELLETYLFAKRINVEDRENENRENDVQEAVGDEWREREREKEREREESEGTGRTKHTHTKVEMEGRRSDRPGGSGRVLSVSLTRIAQSSKPKHLAAHVLRARALYRPESSVERTSNVMIDAELDHYSYIASQLALLVDESSLCVGKAADAKRRIVDRLTRNSGQRLDCPHCLKPTQRHLQHCPTCGKIQIFYH